MTHIIIDGTGAAPTANAATQEAKRSLEGFEPGTAKFDFQATHVDEVSFKVCSRPPSHRTVRAVMAHSVAYPLHIVPCMLSCPGMQ
jgi:hypothetical protein